MLLMLIKCILGWLFYPSWLWIAVVLKPPPPAATWSLGRTELCSLLLAFASLLPAFPWPRLIEDVLLARASYRSFLILWLLWRFCKNFSFGIELSFNSSWENLPPFHLHWSAALFINWFPLTADSHLVGAYSLEYWSPWIVSPSWWLRRCLLDAVTVAPKAELVPKFFKPALCGSCSS